MGRKNSDQKDTLTLEPLADGRFRLFGFIGGEQIRKQGKNLSELEKVKLDLERKATMDRMADIDRAVSPAHLRDADRARDLLGNARISLAEAVRIALATVGTGEPVLASKAAADYEAKLVEDRLSTVHIQNTRLRLAAFLKACGAQMLGEIDTLAIGKYVQRPKVAGYTAVGDATVIRAFLTFCVTRKWLQASPFEVDMKKLRKTARKGRVRPRVMTPAQCQALLDAAIAHDGGNHVPHVILGLWGGIRTNEVERLSSNEVRFEGDHAIVTMPESITKTASYREVAIPANVTPLLKECIERGHMDKNPLGPTLIAGWADIREKAGLIAVTRDKHGNRQITDTVWQHNILRHTGLSFYFRKTGDIQETARQAGHSVAVAFEHYITLTRAEDAPKFYAVTGSLTHPMPEAKVA
jgi:integrase